MPNYVYGGDGGGGRSRRGVALVALGFWLGVAAGAGIVWLSCH
jgi:hypothetical protein